jgi:hypothetical protein
VHEASPVHRLDDCQHLSIAQSLDEQREPVRVGRHRARADQRPVGAQRLPIEALAA